MHSKILKGRARGPAKPTVCVQSIGEGGRGVHSIPVGESVCSLGEGGLRKKETGWRECLFPGGGGSAKEGKALGCRKDMLKAVGLPAPITGKVRGAPFRRFPECVDLCEVELDPQTRGTRWGSSLYCEFSALVSVGVARVDSDPQCGREGGGGRDLPVRKCGS